MSPRARAALLALLGALLLASLAAAPGAGAAVAPDANVTYAVELQEDGDARWTVTARFTLETAPERDAFADLARAYRRGETRSLGLDAFRNASREASLVTDRDMAVTDARRSTATAADIENGTGWLALSFTWENFARADENGDLFVGDAFNTTQGTWFSGLGANETLLITPPETHNPFAGGGVLTPEGFRWTGPQRFGPGSPSAEFTVDVTPEENPWLRPGLIVVGLAALLLVVYLLARRRDVLPRSRDGDDEAVADAADAGDGPDEAEPADDEVDLELLSDEERVERLLERNGGRMKQATIVKETGWSNAKVSQLLSSMAEEGRVDKLRIGRENLISFPDEDVTDLDD
jgi:hypothetical protein